MKTFTDWLEYEAEDCGLCAPPLESQKALHFLKDYLLGENWYVVMPVNDEQVNSVLVHEILLKYSRKYRKEYKRYMKRFKK